MFNKYLQYSLLMKKPQGNYKIQVNKEFILEIKTSYPFGQLNYKDQACSIRYRKTFTDSDYQQTKKKVSRYYRLKHKNLILAKRASQSRANYYVDIFYQYIHDGLEGSISKIKQQYIPSFKEQLIDLYKYLISNNVCPQIKASLIGFDEDTIKYFLPYQTLVFDENLKKRQMTIIKTAQVDTFFNQILKKKRFYRKKSAREFTNVSKSQNPNTQINYNFNSNNLLIPSERQPRNSSLTNAHSAGSAHSRVNVDLTAFDKIRSIDDKINELLAKMRKPSMKLSETRNRSKQNQIIKKRSIQKQQKPIQNLVITKNKNIACHSPSPISKPYVQLKPNNKKQKVEPPKLCNKKDQTYLKKNSSTLPASTLPIIPIFPITPIINRQNRGFDQQSIDTYNQELGEVAEMPKIFHLQMRQTTKSPPKLIFNEKFNEKLHESVGNKVDQEFINEIKNLNKKINDQNNLINKRQKQQKQKQLQKQQEKERERKKDIEKQKQKKAKYKQNQRLNSKQKLKQHDISEMKKQQNLKAIQNSKFIKKLSMNSKNQHTELKRQVSNNNIINNLTNSTEAIHNKIVNHLGENKKLQKSTDKKLKNITQSNLCRQNSNSSSILSLQKKQNKISEIVGFDQMLKNYEIQEQVAGDFNNLFQCEATPTTFKTKLTNNKSRSASSETKNLQQSTSIDSLKQRKDSSKINERVKQALIKSEATLQFYKKLNNCLKK